MSVLLFLAFAARADDPASPTVSAAPGRGITIESADGDFAMNLRARVQLRATVDASLPDEDGARDLLSGAQVRTTRLYWTGHVLDAHNKYVVQLAVAPTDFRDGTISPIFDAYLDFDRNPNASVRVGQHFVPFDRLRTVREFALQLTERPRPVSELTLDRDVGVTLYSNHLGGEESPIAYRVGLFSGRGVNQLALGEPGGLAVARIELNPFGAFDADSEGDQARRADPKLSIGAAAAYNLNTTRQRSTTGTTFVGGTADYRHLAVDGMLKWRGIALEGEIVSREAAQDTIVAAGDADAIERTQSGWGWVAQASWAFAPKHEIVGRYSDLNPREGSDPAWIEKLARTEHEVAAGYNVYLNGHRFKVQLDWIALYGAAGLGEAQHSAHTALDVTF